MDYHKGLVTANSILTMRFKWPIPIVFDESAKLHVASGALGHTHESQTLRTAAEHVLA